MATNFVAKLPTPRTYRSVRSGIPTLGYRYLNVRINSVNDASMSRKNFVNFGPVTPEKTELICELFVRHDKQETLLWQTYGPRDALVSRNSATTKYPYRMELFA